MDSNNIDINNTEFQETIKLIQFTRQSVFLTGKAGTGKSTLLKYICNNTKKKHVILAPTGIAAINVGGSTLHSFFKLPFHPLLPDDPKFSVKRIKDYLKYNSIQQKLIREVELIIIDEISMVRADIIDFIDKVLRIYTRNMREPFGGKQMLFVGDIFQLEPVVKSDEREILQRFYPNSFFFSAYVFREMQLVSIELKKVYRQNDAAFISVLDNIRTNRISASDLQMLNSRYMHDADDVKNHDFNITLATRRDTVDFINSKKLEEIDGNSYTFKGEIQGDFPVNSLPTLMELEFKVGAQVIFIKNDTDKRWVNGTIGIITAIDENGKNIFVTTEDGNEWEVERERWSNVRYTYNEKEKKIEEEELGVFIQFPLRLAWAITIHKSQGLTFRKVTIDFTGGVFAGGQTYVALSRCTSIEGITLKKTISRSDIFVRPEILNFAKQFNNRQAIEQAMNKAQADIEYHTAVESFNKGNFTDFLEHFFIAIHKRYDIEKPLQKRFISRKLETINTLKRKNEELKKKLHENKAMMREYAQEYYLMGNECILQAQNAKAALANYDKAIRLYPEFVDAWVRKGITLDSINEYEQAMECYNRAIEMSPVSFKALYNRGKHYLEHGKSHEAVSDLDKAVSIKPEHSKARKLFGDALSLIGKEEEAEKQWAIAEKIKQNRRKN